MANMTILKALQGYFNEKDSPVHKPLREFASELGKLSDSEKRELADGVVTITGDTLVDSKGQPLAPVAE